MVCVPCFIIPVLLYIWHKFCQPILLRYWNPWQKKDAEGNVIKAAPEFPFQCNNGACTFINKRKPIVTDDNVKNDGVQQQETLTQIQNSKNIQANEKKDN